MFYDFPEDKVCWENESQYMFGPDILVAPVRNGDRRKKRSIFQREAPGQIHGPGKAMREARR